MVRSGDDVLRPSNPHTATIHELLRALHDVGFGGVPVPIGVDPDGRERLRFVDGQVAVPPFPEWFQTDEVLASIAVLMADMHQASREIDPTRLDLRRAVWSDEMPDRRAEPGADLVLCHNDICPENVVCRDGRAVAFVDFDFCAPGRPAYDVATMARMCVPVDDDVNAARLGWRPADRPRRLRLVADAYGLDAAARAEVLGCLDDAIAHGGRWVQSKVDAAEPGFVEMWADMGGMERFDRRRSWWADARSGFTDAMA